MSVCNGYMLISFNKNDSTLVLIKDVKLQERSENVLESEPCMILSKERGNELAVSYKGFFMSCSPRIAVKLLLGTFYPTVLELV
jgi:hypothetical protein